MLVTPSRTGAVTLQVRPLSYNGGILSQQSEVFTFEYSTLFCAPPTPRPLQDGRRDLRLRPERRHPP